MELKKGLILLRTVFERDDGRGVHHGERATAARRSSNNPALVALCRSFISSTTKPLSPHPSTFLFPLPYVPQIILPPLL